MPFTRASVYDEKVIAAVKAACATANRRPPIARDGPTAQHAQELRRAHTPWVPAGREPPRRHCWILEEIA